MAGLCIPQGPLQVLPSQHWLASMGLTVGGLADSGTQEALTSAKPPEFPDPGTGKAG